MNSDFWGSDIHKVTEDAKKIATDEGTVVEFEFNEVTCLVTKDTNTDHLYRDYVNAHLMGWKVIGLNYLPEYSEETSAELAKRIKEREEKRRMEAKIQEEKDNEEKEIFLKKTKYMTIELRDEEKWNKVKEVNKSDYGKATVDYAEGWALLMQVELTKGKRLKDIANQTSYELGFMGITGFMYGCAVSILAECWKHGEELRQWHNAEYGQPDAKGTINPALLTIKSK